MSMIREKWRVDKEYKDLCIKIMQDNLASLRAKCGITQEELAAVIGISRQTYYAFETNKRYLTWNTFLLLLLFYREIKSTQEMLNDLRIFPIELFYRFNDTLEQ